MDRHKYIRFVTDLVDKKSHRRMGIIRATDRLWQQFTPKEEDAVEEILQWFNDFLEVPNKFSKAKRKCGEDVSCRRALSWFKDTAHACIQRARKLAKILDRYVITEMLVTTQPGYIVYEDDDQVAAIPF